jgi:hypothetical protein
MDVLNQTCRLFIFVSNESLAIVNGFASSLESKCFIVEAVFLFGRFDRTGEGDYPCKASNMLKAIRLVCSSAGMGIMPLAWSVMLSQISP